MSTAPIVNPINAFADLFFYGGTSLFATLFLAWHWQVCNIDANSYALTWNAGHVVFLYAEWLDALP